MKTCSFFGDRYMPKDTERELRKVLTDLIVKEKVILFLVGNKGSFDRMVLRLLKELETDFPHIRFAIVSAYLPKCKKKTENVKTIYPVDIKGVPRKSAITYRNEWMLRRSDYVVTYGKHKLGIELGFKTMSENLGLSVLEIAALCP